MKKPKTKKNIKDIKPSKDAKGGREQSRLSAKYGANDPRVAPARP